MPLHARIDQVMEASHPAGRSIPASDADFIRRASLALSGVIPTATQARAFLNDTAPDKRERLVDQLLASPEYVRWMTVRLDVTLMERRPEKHAKVAEWLQYLESAVVANKPWHQLVREILSYDGADEKTRGMGRWLLEHEGDPNALTRDVSRIFFGRDIACAQCHDHPRIADYLQRDYYGLQAFFCRTSLFQPDEKIPALIAENATGEATFTSVFTKVGGSTGPRLLGEDELPDPPEIAGDPWTVPPDPKDNKKRAVPKFSRRAQLPASLSDGNHPAFRRNIANRLWAFAFGHGLVEPVDLQHSGNPPANPALLDLLADGMAEMNFDMKAFLRELVLTKAFQSSMDLPAPSPDVATRLNEQLPSLEEAATKLAKAASEADEKFEQARKSMLEAQRSAEPITSELKKRETTVAESRKAADAAGAEMKKAETALAEKRELQKMLAEATAKATEALAKLPGSPELTQAANLFRARADQKASEVPGVEKDAATRKAEADAKAQALLAAQASVGEAQGKVEAAKQGIETLQETVDTAVTQKEAALAEAKAKTKLVSENKAFVDWTSAAAQEASARESAGKIETQFTSLRDDAQRLTASVAEQSTKLAALEQAAGSASAQMKPAQDALANQKAAAALLAEAAAKAAAVAAKLPNDVEIQAATAAVKTKTEAVTAEIATLEKQAVEAEQRAQAAMKVLADSKAAVGKTNSELAALQARLPTLEADAKAAREKATAAATAATKAREQLMGVWTDSFAATTLSPLMPEQLCWSVMQATGIFEQQHAQAATEWDQKNPLSEADKANPAKQAERRTAIQKAFIDKIRPHEDQYIRAFGGAPGQPQTDFFATPEQALYFENGGILRAWTSGLSARLAGLKEPPAIAEELFLTTLTRMPSDEEKRDVASTLAAQPPEKVPGAINDLAWSLLTSVEFRFSH